MSPDQSIPSAGTDMDWIMKTNPTPYWKFILGANLFKAYQLDYVEKKGDVITVAMQSGKRCSFQVGEFKGSYTQAQGVKDVTLKSTTDPKQKILFRETLLQMPEQWWNELETKLGAAETGLSKVLNTVNDVLDVVTKLH